MFVDNNFARKRLIYILCFIQKVRYDYNLQVICLPLAIISFSSHHMLDFAGDVYHDQDDRKCSNRDNRHHHWQTQCNCVPCNRNSKKVDCNHHTDCRYNFYMPIAIINTKVALILIINKQQPCMSFVLLST